MVLQRPHSRVPSGTSSRLPSSLTMSGQQRGIGCHITLCEGGRVRPHWGAPGSTRGACSLVVKHRGGQGSQKARDLWGELGLWAGRPGRIPLGPPRWTALGSGLWLAGGEHLSRPHVDVLPSPHLRPRQSIVCSDENVTVTPLVLSPENSEAPHTPRALPGLARGPLGDGPSTPPALSPSTCSAITVLAGDPESCASPRAPC